MIRKIKKYIENQNLLPQNHNPSNVKIIVGLSGGADSVALLSILHDMGYKCISAHCNFHLRGEEALRDEKIAEQISLNLNSKFIKQDFNTLEYAKEKGISIEMAARNLRYEWFEQIRKQIDAAVIAVAHHSDDNIETFLLNMIRGTGIKGLTGILPINGKVIRPLLAVSKNDILEYLRNKGISYVTDSSNLQDEFTRNKIRLSLIPLLQSINPSVTHSIVRTIENLTEVEKIYNKEIKKNKEEIFHSETGIIDIKKLKDTISPQSVLFEILKDYNFDRDVIKNIFLAINSQSGKEFYSSDYTLIRDRDKFTLFPKKKKTETIYYKVEKDRQKIFQPLSLEIIFEQIKDSFQIYKRKDIACLDADKLEFPLTLRKWEKGDKFRPFGMKGFQKLSDYFNNNKIDKQEKQNIWLLCSGNNIAWIIGYRTDDRYKIDNESKNVCIIKLF